MNKVWVAIVLAIILVPTGVLLRGYFIHPAYGDDFVRVGKINIHFGSQISDCMAVQIDPLSAQDLVDSKAFTALFDPDGVKTTGPGGEEVIDDAASRKYAIATYELGRILVPLGHTQYTAYTHPYNNETESVRSLSDGNSALPIVLFEIGDETLIRRVAPGQIIVRGADADEINHAACRLDLEILRIVYGIRLPE